MVPTRRLLKVVGLTAVLLVVVAGCAAGPNTAAAAGGPDPAGFWLGLWHGIICPITFVVSLFNEQVGVYEVRNSGNWYNFGFVLGVLILGSSGGGGAARSRR